MVPWVDNLQCTPREHQHFNFFGGVSIKIWCPRHVGGSSAPVQATLVKQAEESCRAPSRSARDHSGDAAPTPGHLVAARLFRPPARDPVGLGARVGNERISFESNSNSKTLVMLPI